MNDGGEKRIKRIVGVFENERDGLVVALNKCRQAEEYASRTLEDAIAREQEALRARSEGNAADWEQEAAWRVHLGRLREVAEAQHERSKVLTASAIERVRESDSRVRKVGVVLDRMAEERKRDEARQERKAEDEWVAANHSSPQFAAT